jgi:hypothetical protein
MPYGTHVALLFHIDAAQFVVIIQSNSSPATPSEERRDEDFRIADRLFVAADAA